MLDGQPRDDGNSLSTNTRDKYTLNDLPAFSPWPRRLLGLEPLKAMTKTKEEVIREYDTDKWGPFLVRYREAKEPVPLETIDEWSTEEQSEWLCSVGEHFELLSAFEARTRYLSLVESTLRPHLPASAIVELGAGYGTILLAIASKEPFSSMRLIGSDLTASGVDLMRCLAADRGQIIHVGQCDLAEPGTIDLPIPPGAIIYTSCALACIPVVPEDLVAALATYKPRIVLHVEPCYEHHDQRSLIGLLRRRYAQVNDYNMNLVTLLSSQESKGVIKIVDERSCVFGLNPLLPVSVLAWQPLL